MKKKNLLQRTIIIAIVTILGLYIVIGPRRRPHWRDFTWAGIKATLRENIHLGLDLKGGSHLVMRVKTEEFLKHLTEGNAVAAQNAAKDAGFEIKQARGVATTGNFQVILEPADSSKISDIQAAVEKKVELGDRAGWSFSSPNGQAVWTLTAAAQRTLADDATQQALKIIETRINALGVTEPTLQTHGAQSSHQILLQMPGVTDPERVKTLLAGESRLELAHIVSPPSPAPSQTFATKEEAIASLNSGGIIPANRRVLPYSERMELTSANGQNGNEPKPQKQQLHQAPPTRRSRPGRPRASPGQRSFHWIAQAWRRCPGNPVHRNPQTAFLPAARYCTQGAWRI